MRSRNTGEYTVEELNELVRHLKYLGYHPARGGGQTDFLSCEIPVPTSDASEVPKRLKAKFAPLFPRLALSFGGLPGGKCITLNVENGDKLGNLAKDQFKIAEKFESELETELAASRLKMVRSDDPAYSFIPGP